MAIAENDSSNILVIYQKKKKTRGKKKKKKSQDFVGRGTHNLTEPRETFHQQNMNMRIQ